MKIENGKLKDAKVFVSATSAFCGGTHLGRLSPHNKQETQFPAREKGGQNGYR